MFFPTHFHSYRAVRGEDPDGPPYAVKIAWGAISKEQNRRFRREQEILHHLDHPAITCCHDFGETEDGRLYIVMEYLDGDRIDRQCDAEGLNVVQRLEARKSWRPTSTDSSGLQGG